MAMLRINSSMVTVLPTPAPPNRPTLPPLAMGHMRSMTFTPGLEQFDVALLVFERRRVPVYRQTLAGVDRALLVDGVAQHVHDAAEGLLAHRDGDGLSRVRDREAAREALGRAHGDGAHDAIAELLLHLERQSALRDDEGVVNLRDLLPRKFDVDDGADDLDDFAAAHGCCFPCTVP